MLRLARQNRLPGTTFVTVSGYGTLAHEPSERRWSRGIRKQPVYHAELTIKNPLHSEIAYARTPGRLHLYAICASARLLANSCQGDVIAFFGARLEYVGPHDARGTDKCRWVVYASTRIHNITRGQWTEEQEQAFAELGSQHEREDKAARAERKRRKETQNEDSPI